MKLNVFGNKKGSLTDPIFTGAYILSIAITILICLFVWISFQSIMETTITGTAVEPILDSVMTSLRTAYFSMDYVYPLLVGGLILVSSIFAYKTGSNIVWGILSIIFWAIALLMSVVFVNVYLSVSSEFPTIYAAMPIMDVIMRNMHFMVLGWLVIISFFMFRKNNQEDDMSEIQRRAYSPQ